MRVNVRTTTKRYTWLAASGAVPYRGPDLRGSIRSWILESASFLHYYNSSY